MSLEVGYTPLLSPLLLAPQHFSHVPLRRTSELFCCLVLCSSVLTCVYCVDLCVLCVLCRPVYCVYCVDLCVLCSIVLTCVYCVYCVDLCSIV